MAQDILSSLPPEYAQQLAQILQRQQLAQTVGQQALAPSPTEMVSGIAVKQGGLNGILRALTGQLANSQFTQAQQDALGVRKQYDDAQNAAIQQYQGLQDPQAQEQFSQLNAGKFPLLAAIAKAQADKRMKLTEAGITALKDADPVAAVTAARSGNLPGAGYALPTPKAPEFSSVQGPDGAIPTVTNYDRLGVPKASFGPGAASKNVVNLPGTETKEVVASREKELATKAANYDSAKTLYLNTQRAVEALQNGAQAGSGAGAEQWMRKAYQFLGGDPKNLTETTNLEQALGGQILENARKLAPVTEVDLQQLKDILGSASTDPQALVKGLAFAGSLSVKHMQDFTDYMNAQTENVGKTAPGPLQDSLRTIFAGANVGREPPQMFGNTPFRIELVRNLAKMGFDKEKLKNVPTDVLKDIFDGDPTQVGVQNSIGMRAKGANPAPAAPAQLDTKKIYTLEELKAMGKL